MPSTTMAGRGALVCLLIPLLWLVAATGLAGCTKSPPSEPDRLVINEERLTPPDHYANVTEADLETYPVLRDLFSEWEKNGSALQPYPFEDGMRIVRMFQDRAPNASWGIPEFVWVAYNGHYLALWAGRGPSSAH